MSTNNHSQSESHPLTFSKLVEALHSTFEQFPDKRTGDNVIYSMADAAMGAFSVFFTQSSSFLDFQRIMKASQGCSNTQIWVIYRIVKGWLRLEDGKEMYV